MKLPYIVPVVGLLLAPTSAAVIPAWDGSLGPLIVSKGVSLEVPALNSAEFLESRQSPAPQDGELFTKRKGNGGHSCKSKQPTFDLIGFPLEATCVNAHGTAIWNRGTLQSAGRAAARLDVAFKQVGTQHYPHKFFNFGNAITNFEGHCNGDFQEFPLIKTGEVFSGGIESNPEEPEEFRIVVSVGKTAKNGYTPVRYCGLMAHPGTRLPNGRWDNSFIECTWKN